MAALFANKLPFYDPITTMDTQSTRILFRWPSISRSHRVSNATALNQIRLGMLLLSGMVIGILFV